MVNVWKIAPGDKAYLWEECREQGCITINWMNKTNFKQFLKPYKSREDRIKALIAAKVGTRISANSILYFVDDIQQGDTVVANKGNHAIVGIGKITSDYLDPDHSSSPRNKEEKHRQVRLVDWIIDKPIDNLPMNFFGHMPATVLPLDAEKCRKIKQAYLDTYKHDLELKRTLDELFPPPPPPVGTTMKKLLEQFGQIIAYGPPGTGKTREAKRVALALLSGKEPDENSTDDKIEESLKTYRKNERYDLVVFHPAYEYEQFVGGIEPTLTETKQVAFQPKEGVFLRLCRKAKKNENEIFVLIIDEINRGNLPKLLGELVYALEYRGHEVTLPFEFEKDRTLCIPKNLYVIATMNSSDRSIGHIDVAIRRRFGLFPLGPKAEVVRAVWRNLEEEDYGNRLANLMDELNRVLKGNDSNAEAELGVGHSYFLPKDDATGDEAKRQVEMKWTYQVQPLLREYEQLLNRGTDLQKYFNPSLENLLAQM